VLDELVPGRELGVRTSRDGRTSRDRWLSHRWDRRDGDDDRRGAGHGGTGGSRSGQSRRRGLDLAVGDLGDGLDVAVLSSSDSSEDGE
jgi:hypothetical protein